MKHDLRLKITATVTAVAGYTAILFVGSANPIPSVVAAVCIGWWLLFGYANNWFKKSKRRKGAKRLSATHYNNVEKLSDYKKKRRAM